jgi:hypothetical protein
MKTSNPTTSIGFTELESIQFNKPWFDMRSSKLSDKKKQARLRQ